MPLDSDVNIDNDREWRQYQFRKFDSIDTKLESIGERLVKIEIKDSVVDFKIYLIGGLFGALGTALMSIIIAVVTK